MLVKMMNSRIRLSNAFVYIFVYTVFSHVSSWELLTITFNIVFFNDKVSWKTGRHHRTFCVIF